MKDPIYGNAQLTNLYGQPKAFVGRVLAYWEARFIAIERDYPNNDYEKDELTRRMHGACTWWLKMWNTGFANPN